MILRLTANPNPVPRAPFVEAKRLNSRGSSSSGIPGPLSSMSTKTAPADTSTPTPIKTAASARPSTASIALVTTLRTAR